MDSSAHFSHELHGLERRVWGYYEFVFLTLLSASFLITVLQDYGRSQGISTDALTFTHHVISDTTDVKDREFSIIIQKKLNIVRRAFKVLEYFRGWKG